MTCPICGGKNCDYWPDGVYCRQCKAKHPYPKTDLEATIDAVLAGCISLCLDNAADVAALKGALLGALRGVDVAADLRRENEALRGVAEAAPGALAAVGRNAMSAKEGAGQNCPECRQFTPAGASRYNHSDDCRLKPLADALAALDQEASDASE